MKKGRVILGIFLLIIGILSLGFGGIAYLHYTSNSEMIASGLAPNNATNTALVNTQFSDAMIGFIIGLIFFVIGLILIIVGFGSRKD